MAVLLAGGHVLLEGAIGITLQEVHETLDDDPEEVLDPLEEFDHPLHDHTVHELVRPVDHPTHDQCFVL